MHSSAEPEAARSNWAGNYIYRAASLTQPSSIAELQQLVATAPRVKALGARHSFNSIADTPGAQISLAHFKSRRLDRSDAAHPTVTVGAGVTYGEIAPWLHQQGFAVPNLASLPHISVVGACATATHGSGIDNRSLSSAVSMIEFVDGNGKLVCLTRATDPDIFAGCIVSLGALGIVTSITLDLIPSFNVAQTVYENLPFAALEHNLRAIFSAGYSVSLFTDWQEQRATQVWVKSIADEVDKQVSAREHLFGATRQTQQLHPLPRHSAENCTEQLGGAGPWHERLPHFRMDFTPSSGAELQSEYFVPLAHAYDAILAIEELKDRIAPHLFIAELRTIAADDLWLSMAYARDSLAIHFTWKPESDAVLGLLPAIEAALEPFAARPHWGKLYTTSQTSLHQLYPRLDAFRELVLRFDPDGRFRNDYLISLLG